MKTHYAALCCMVATLTACGSSAGKPQDLVLFERAVGSWGNQGEDISGVVSVPHLLLTEFEHGHTVWLSAPATTFFRLMPNGSAAEIPDPILEGPDIWENVDLMRKRFGCAAPLLPPTGGAAKMFARDPDSWRPLGCAVKSEWKAGFYQRFKSAIFIGPFLKRSGQRGMFVFIVSGGHWTTQDVYPETSRLGEIPAILMGGDTTSASIPSTASGGGIIR